jgi:hypothetical protein
MAKVIVERPRLGRSGAGKAKGYRKRLQKSWPEGLPRQEGIKRRLNGRMKSFNEHLGPLRRFLNSNVGRPWDKVFAEISAHINVNSVVQAHIRTHLFQYVAVHVVLIDGVPCSGEGGGLGRTYGRPLSARRGWTLFYVCPRTGLLRRVKRPARRPPDEEVTHRIKVDDTHLYCRIKGDWHIVTVRRLDPEQVERLLRNHYPTIEDVVLGRRISVSEAIRLYGSPVVGIASRQLGKRELRQLPIPID